MRKVIIAIVFALAMVVPGAATPKAPTQTTATKRQPYGVWCRRIVTGPVGQARVNVA